MYAAENERRCVPVDKIGRDAERGAEALEGQTSVALEELGICQDTHFAYVESGVGGEDARRDKMCLFESRWIENEHRDVDG